MDKDTLFERLLDLLSGSYDITRPAMIAGRNADALARLIALNSKYVLDRKHTLWEANAFEYAAILRTGALTAAEAADWFRHMTVSAEAELVHPEGKYPPEGHMYSYLTVILLCDRVTPEAAEAVRRMRFTKNYLFSLRGWAEGRILAVDCGTGESFCNRKGQELKQLTDRLLSK